MAEQVSERYWPDMTSSRSGCSGRWVTTYCAVAPFWMPR